MLERAKKKILKYIAHLLTPYLREENSHHEQREEMWIKGHMRSCGSNVNFGISYLIHGAEYISIGDNFRAVTHLRIQAMCTQKEEQVIPTLKIGNNVSFEDSCHIGCIDSVSIGDGTMVASKVFITDHFHGDITKDDIQTRPELRPLSHKPVKIGKNVWIGDGACILPGVTLGDNVIVGANAVVTHSFMENSVIAGCPAKLIKTLE